MSLPTKIIQHCYQCGEIISKYPTEYRDKEVGRLTFCSGRGCFLNWLVSTSPGLEISFGKWQIG